MNKRMVYAPVSSWRLGRSLGIDLICGNGEKICPFDCVYCSLGRTTKKSVKRENFINVKEMQKELRDCCLTLKNILKGFKTFENDFEGKLSLEVMFVEENKHYANEIAKIIRSIDPDEVQINTPTRSCGVESLPPHQLEKIKKSFSDLNCLTAYEAKKIDIGKVVGVEKLDLLKRKNKKENKQSKK